MDPIERLGKMFNVIGLSYVESKVFLHLYLFDPLAYQEDLVSKLEISRSAVSTALKSLCLFGLVDWRKVDNRKQYFVKVTPKELILMFFRKHFSLRQELKERISDNLVNLSRDEQKIILERLKAHEKLAEVLSSFEKKILEVEDA